MRALSKSGKDNYRRLGDVASFINGYAFKPEDWANTGVPIIRIQDLTGSTYETHRFDGKIEDQYRVERGDVLISWSASLGVYVWNRETAVLNQHIFKVVFDKGAVDKTYFIHQVCHILQAAASQAHGATMKHLTRPVFNALSFYCPPLADQMEIARRLDAVSSAIQLRQQQLARLDQLAKSRFIEMFGGSADFDRWPTCTVNDVADVGVGVVIKPTQYYADSGIPAFRSLNIGPMRINDTDWVHFTSEGHAKNQKSVVHEGDVLVVRSGAPGTACVATHAVDGYNAIDIIIAHPDRRKIHPVFLAQFTNMPHGMQYIRAKTGGAAQQHFNIGGYKAMKIILPPLALQTEFAAFVEQLDKSKVTIRRSMEKLETLKRSLMQEYFG